GAYAHSFDPCGIGLTSGQSPWMAGHVEPLVRASSLGWARVALGVAVATTAQCARSGAPAQFESAPAPRETASESSDWHTCVLGDCPTALVKEAAQRCGAIEVNSRFVGQYELDESRRFPHRDRPGMAASRRALADTLRRQYVDQYSNFAIEP